MSTNGHEMHSNAQVQQAETMVSVQAHCTLAEARLKLNERAKLLRRTPDDVAAKVVGRRISFR